MGEQLAANNLMYAKASRTMQKSPLETLWHQFIIFFFQITMFTYFTEQQNTTNFFSKAFQIFMHAYYWVLTGTTLFVSKAPAVNFSSLSFAFIKVTPKISDWENLRVLEEFCKANNSTIYIIFLSQEDRRMKEQHIVVLVTILNRIKNIKFYLNSTGQEKNSKSYND